MTVTIDAPQVPRGVIPDPDSDCEMCDARATVILSVPSQGVQAPLCQMHQQMRVLQLEQSLTGPFHVTGLEAAPSAEEAALQLAQATALELEDANDLNAHLRRRVYERTGDNDEEHRAVVEGMKGELEQTARERDDLRRQLHDLQSQRQGQ
jgi:hypothetical protein